MSDMPFFSPGGEGTGGGIIIGGDAVLTSSLKATKAIGGIPAGKIYEAGTKIEVVLRDLLSSTDTPTLTPPKVTLTATGDRLLESGSSINAKLTAAFDRGSIVPAYGTSGYRAGIAKAYTLNGAGDQDSGIFNVVVTESNNSFTAAVRYAAGEQPKDSAGNNYGAPLAEGTVSSNTITYEFVDAIWSNENDISAPAKGTLISKNEKTKTFVFPPQTAANPETFDIPASWTVTAVEVLNEITNKFEDVSAEFTISDTQHDNAGGTPVAYKRYTDNRGYSAGVRTIRITWN